jgi:hypothetical protein
MPKATAQTWTIQFRVQNITSWKEGFILANAATLNQLLVAKSIMLYIWITRRMGSEVQQFTTLCAQAGPALSKLWPVELPELVATIVLH